MTVYPDPFRLRVLKTLTATIETVTIANGYKHDLTGSVFRGRSLFGQNDPLPMVSILEHPLPLDRRPSPLPSVSSNGDWDLLIQGFSADDEENPTDPAHQLMADVKTAIMKEIERKQPGRNGVPGTPDPFGLGFGQVIDGVRVGNAVTEVKVGPGVVRPPEQGISDKAYFWLTLTVKIVEDNTKPFL